MLINTDVVVVIKTFGCLYSWVLFCVGAYYPDFTVLVEVLLSVEQNNYTTTSASWP